MKIQNSFNLKLKNIHHEETEKTDINKDKKTTQYDRRNYQQKKTPLPIIKINGKLKNTQPNLANPNDPQQKVEQVDQNEAQIDENEHPFFNNKTKPIIKKKINFQISYKNIEKQSKQLGSLFVHTLNKLSCDRRFAQKIQQQDPINKNFPSQIVNIFYGQNVHNYNPYIEALDKLYESFRGKISQQMMERIKKLCYIGLARSHLKAQKYSQTPKYRRVNILIRTYMYENIQDIIEEKAQNYENIVFIPCNKNAMSFSHKHFPEQLKSICSRERFERTIDNVNRIIEDHYIDYKQMNRKQTVSDRWGQNLCYLLTILFLIIFLISNNKVFIYILAFFIVSSLALYLYEAKQTLSMLGSSNNIIQRMQEDIQNYLKDINTHNIEWKVGEDFYWLEIHYIKKVKKKPAKYTS